MAGGMFLLFRNSKFILQQRHPPQREKPEKKEEKETEKDTLRPRSREGDTRFTRERELHGKEKKTLLC